MPATAIVAEAAAIVIAQTSHVTTGGGHSICPRRADIPRSSNRAGLVVDNKLCDHHVSLCNYCDAQHIIITSHHDHLTMIAASSKKDLQHCVLTHDCCTLLLSPYPMTTSL